MNAFYRSVLIGAGGLLALVMVIRLCLGMFVGDFDRGQVVRVEADRAGLLLEPNAVVTLRGVAVGHVMKVDQVRDGALLTVRIDESAARDVPADVAAVISASTVFGPKSVRLEQRATGTQRRIRDGDSIPAVRVSGEYNATFDALLQTLTDLRPVKLNAALNGLASTLEDTGADAGRLLHDLQTFVASLLPHLPALEGDLMRLPGVSGEYSQHVRELSGTLRHSGVIAALVAEQAADLDEFLIAATLLGNDVGTLLTRLQPVLALSLSELAPTLSLLDEYAPQIPCLLQGIDKTAAQLRKVMLPPSQGGTSRNVHVQLGITQSLPAYRYPNDLPTVNATGGPNCRGLPVIDRLPTRVQAAVGTNPFPADHDGSVLPDTPLGLILFGEQLPGLPDGGR